MTQNSNIVIKDEVFYYGLVDWLILQGLEKFFPLYVHVSVSLLLMKPELV